MLQNLLYISSTPLTRGSDADPAAGFKPAVASSGPWQIRPHWILDLVTVIDPLTGRSADPLGPRLKEESDAAFQARRLARAEDLTARVLHAASDAGDDCSARLLRVGVCNASCLPSPRVNTSALEVFVQRITDLDLRIGFEVMGWPSSITTDMGNRTQACLWAGLAKAAVAATVKVAGPARALEYRWEGWNEVRIGGDFDGVWVPLPDGINNLWDGTAAAVDAVLGREAATLGAHSMDAWGPTAQTMLLHMANGTSVLFGPDYEVRRADFLPYHHKGHDNTDPIIQGEADEILELLPAHPEWVRRDKSSAPPPGTKPWAAPWVNDEADPREGWDRIEDWRGDARYPAMMAKEVAQHLTAWMNPNASVPPVPPPPSSDSINPFGPQGLPLGFIAFDAAFMNVGPTGFFDFRSFTTRFMMNQTTPRGVETVRKLALNVMAPLALLGDKQVAVVAPNEVGSPPLDGDWPPGAAQVGALVTTRSPASAAPWLADEVTVAVYASQDSTNTTGQNVTFSVAVSGAGAVTGDSSAQMAVFAVHDRPTDPAAVWKAAGSPPFPSKALLRQMRAGQEVAPVSVGPLAAAGSTLYFNASAPGVPATGVYVAHACSKPAAAPPAPASAPYAHRSTLIGEQVLLKWVDSGARCLATYEVEVSSDGGRTWTSSTNGTKTISLAWLHSADDSTTPLQFRVRAVDYWGREGAFSQPSEAV